MKFSCEKALLQSAILTASRAVSPKSTIPALEGLLLEAEENGTVFLTGYNQETGIRSAIQADVSQPGSMVLPARLFGEIVRKLPDDMVLFQEEALKVHIACGYSEFDLLGIDPERRVHCVIAVGHGAEPFKMKKDRLPYEELVTERR